MAIAGQHSPGDVTSTANKSYIGSNALFQACRKTFKRLTKLHELYNWLLNKVVRKHKNTFDITPCYSLILTDSDQHISSIGSKRISIKDSCTRACVIGSLIGYC